MIYLIVLNIVAADQCDIFANQYDDNIKYPDKTMCSEVEQCFKTLLRHGKELGCCKHDYELWTINKPGKESEQFIYKSLKLKKVFRCKNNFDTRTYKSVLKIFNRDCNPLLSTDNKMLIERVENCPGLDTDVRSLAVEYLKCEQKRLSEIDPISWLIVFLNLLIGTVVVIFAFIILKYLCRYIRKLIFRK